jgi:hypothetical protein
MVARADGAGATLLAREAAGALATFSDEPAGLVTGCRRLVDRHPEIGPLWWLAARVLLASEPGAEVHRSANQLDEDDTAGVLAAELPGSATAVVVGWPEQVAWAIRRRGDVEVLVVDFEGEGQALAHRLSSAGVDAYDLPASGVAAAAVVADLVLVEAVSAGEGGLLAAPGSHSAAAVARLRGVPVWGVAGVGRVLPPRLWESQLERVEAQGREPWERSTELVPLDLIDRIVGPNGVVGPEAMDTLVDCGVAPELLRRRGL